MIETSAPITLAIESSVAGGSISLLRGKTEIARSANEGLVSRAEELLLAISLLLERSGIGRGEISRLAVSTGPGSYTGIRIGIATALGLKNGLNIPCVGLSVMQAMTLAGSSEKSKITAIPMGRNDVCRQLFDPGNSDPGGPTLSTFLKFVDFAKINRDTEFIVENSLYERILAEGQPPNSLLNAGSNLAYLIGLASINSDSGKIIEPIFVKAALITVI